MSVAMMLDHLGLTDAARDVEKAVATDLLNRGDAKRGTTEVGAALVALVK
jgi:3-isopropylmalate dehydrogenase